MNSDGAGVADATITASLEPEAVLERGRRLLRDGRQREAEAVFRELLALPAYAARGLYGVGVARLAAGDLDVARSFFEQTLEHDPTDANSVFQLGAIAEKRSDPAGARSYYERTLALYPKHVGAQQRLRALTPAPPAPPAPGTEPSGSAIYDYLRQDPSSLARQAVAAIDALEMQVHPGFAAYAGRRFARFALLIGLALGVAGLLARVPVEAMLPASVTLPVDLASVARLIVVAVAAAAVAATALGYARVRSTRVTLRRGRLQVRSGLLAKRLVNVELWRVHDVELERSLINR